jgi:hypothetical protein
VRPESCELSELVRGQPANPKAWEWQPSLACVSVMAGAKRRQGRARGVRVNPESYIVEGADGFIRVRRQHPVQKTPMHGSLPGARARIETLRILTEQERPIVNRRMVTAGAGMQGKTGAYRCKRAVGVGLSHSSEETGEGGVASRTGGAKGRAVQGTRRRER